MNSITNKKEQYKEVPVLYGERVNSKPFQTTNLYEVFDTIKKDEYLKEVIPQVRSILDKNERQKFKLNKLPFFTVGSFKNNERQNATFISTQYSIYDYDHVDKLDEVWMRVISDKNVSAAFHSPSGDGIKVIYKFSREITDPDEYSNIYKTYAYKFNIDLGEEADKCSDVSRACYFSYDPDMYINPDAKELDADIEIDEEIKVANRKNRKELLNKLKNGVPAGENRTPTLTQALGILRKNGMDREFSLSFAMGWNQLNEEPLDEEKVIYTVNDTYDRYAGQSISEKTKDFYSYETGIFEARIVGGEFAIRNIGHSKYYIKMGIGESGKYVQDEKEMKKQIQKEKNRYLSYVVKNKDLHTLRRIDYLSDAYAAESYYAYNDKEAVFSAYIKPAPVKVKDNDFIESYLDEVMGEQKDFIKNWMAVYAFSNYRKLANLILIGPRGSSKSTFSEFIGGIFPTLTSFTKELEGDFNPDADKKLVIIDESDSKGKIQYRTLKKYSGQKYIQVNKKYLPQYSVRNNLNIIIMSNDDNAIYVEREEMPYDENNNQFFVYKFKELNSEIDPDLSEKLQDRIGYYIKTELKDIFKNISFHGCRYSIPVPITEEEKMLFRSSVTEVESDADLLIRKLIIGMSDPNFAYSAHVEDGYIPTSFFSDYNIRSTKLKVIKDLQRRGYLTKDNIDKHQVKNNRLFCYKLGDRWLCELDKEKKVMNQPEQEEDMFEE